MAQAFPFISCSCLTDVESSSPCFDCSQHASVHLRLPKPQARPWNAGARKRNSSDSGFGAKTSSQQATVANVVCMCCCFLTRGWIRFGRAGGEGSSRSSRVRYNGCVTDFAAFLVRMRPSIFEHPPQGQPMAAVVASPVDRDNVRKLIYLRLW